MKGNSDRRHCRPGGKAVRKHGNLSCSGFKNSCVCRAPAASAQCRRQGVAKPADSKGASFHSTVFHFLHNTLHSSCEMTSFIGLLDGYLSLIVVV